RRRAARPAESRTRWATAAARPRRAPRCRGRRRRCAWCRGLYRRYNDCVRSCAELDLGGADDRRGVGSRDVREVYLAGAPAVVAQRALEGRASGDAADEANARRIVALGDADHGLVGLRTDGAHPQVLAEGLATAAVDVAHRGADLGVAVAVDVFHEKV